jgi:selenocysteine-specific elongation factor
VLTFGIAGHVDHGKTSLVRALTGIETDRLPEEQRRGISIELGFAHLDVPGDGGAPLRIGIIDMPGHERFVRRMIAGASAVDAVLLVVAADEGVMPQGREHLAICRLLGVPMGAVVLTKTDLVDAGLLELAHADVAELCAGTFLENAPVWSCSVRDPASIAALADQIAAFARQCERRQSERLRDLRERPFRLCVDRAFTLHGRGTVVTGTHTHGELRPEDQLAVLPQGAVFRVRGLERHGRTLDVAVPPGRLALNLASAAVADVPAGSVLGRPHTVAVGERFDAWLQLLPHVAQPLPVRKRGTVHLGTTEASATIVQLSGQPLRPGSAAFVQVRLDQPLAIAPDEAFVVRGSQRDARHGQTLAGGRVLHPCPPRHKLGDAAVIAALEALASRVSEAMLKAVIDIAGTRGASDASLEIALPLPPAQVAKVAKIALAAGVLRRLGTPPRWYSPSAAQALEDKITSTISNFHATWATRPGPDLEALHGALGEWLDPTAIAALVAAMVRRGSLQQRGTAVALPGFVPKAAVRKELLEAVVLRLAGQGLQVEGPTELAVGLAADPREVQAALQQATADGRLTKIAQDLHVTAAEVVKAVDRVIAKFATTDSFSTGELKDLLGLTRKHLIPLAEWLDAQKVTVRDPAGNRKIRQRALDAWREKTANLPSSP